MGQVRGEVLGTLGHRLHRGDRHASPPAFLPEEAEVLLPVRRDFVDHGHSLVPVLLQPAHDERGVAAAVAVTESEAVVAVEPLRAAPADEGDLELIGERTTGDRVVGAVRAGDRDAALVDQPSEPIGRVLRRPVRQPVLGVQDVFDLAVEQTTGGGLVERHPMDLVVSAARPVEGSSEPPDLDRLRHDPVPSLIASVGWVSKKSRMSSLASTVWLAPGWGEPGQMCSPPRIR